MKLTCVLWVLCFPSFICNAEEEIKGVITKVFDGNTIEISLDNQEKYKVFMHGIDSPELGQNYSEQAKSFLEKLLLNKSVTIVLHGKDRLGNRLGEIQVDGGPNPCHELIKAGLAWTAEKEPIKELELLKEQARVDGKGLWGDANPTPPWIFRRQQSMMQLKSS